MQSTPFASFNRSFRDYLVWWAEQMRALLPARLRMSPGDMTDALVLEAESAGPDSPPAVAAVLRRGDYVTRLGRFGLDLAGLAEARAAAGMPGQATPILLRLPAGALLEKQLTFPLAAERELRGALTYEMDRETPFTAGEVWWNWRIDRRDRQRGRICLTLFLVPKSSGQDIVSALTRGGLRPIAIETATATGRRHIIPVDAEFDPQPMLPVSAKLLAAACLALAAISVIMPFARQSLALGKVEDRIAALKPQTDAVLQLRRQVGGPDAASALGQDGTADVLAVLAKTTHILPDDTHLTALTLHRRELSISGQSGEAAKLIGLLAADRFFKDPAFSAAVTRLPDAKLDAFSITAEIRP